MKKLQPTEKELIGKHIFIDGKTQADETCKKIEYLISNVLTKIAESNDGWDILYQNENDGRYWELTYPDSEAHGGGAPSLVSVLWKNVQNKYQEKIKRCQKKKGKKGARHQKGDR